MIKIQLKKSDAQERGLTRDSYLFKDKQHSLRMPVAVAAFLTGLLVYLKSVLGVQAAAPSPETPKLQEQEASPLKPDPVALAFSSADPEHKSAEKENEIEDFDMPRRGGGHVFSDFLRHESLPDFDRIAALHARRQAEAQTFSSIAKNDNEPPVAQDGASRQSGAGGGGGDAGAAGSGGSTGGGSGNGSGPNNGGGAGNTPPAAANRAPTLAGPVRLPSVIQSHTVFIPMALLLSGSIDLDKDALAVVELTASAGTLKTAEGGWTYMPAVGHLGPVTFSYGVSDGTEKIAQTALLDVVRAPPIIGVEQADLLVGTEFDDEIQGLGGDDTIDGRGGADTIFGGTGDDHIVAGSGDDIVYAGLGNDIVFGGTGNDIIFGGGGNDRLFGDAGDDVIHGDDGDDLARGGSGSDQLFGAAGRDILHGDDGRDHLDGGDGDDALFGGDGSDVLIGGLGSDFIDSGPGDDVVLAANDQADDVFAGGEGFDTLTYAGATEGVTIDFAVGSSMGAQIGHDFFSGFEAMASGAGADLLQAATSGTVLMAGSGADVLNGGSGNDTLLGEDGADRLNDGGGVDLVNGGEGDDIAFASIDAANDAFDGGEGFDTISYATATESIVFDLVIGAASSASSGSDKISGFEAVIGGKGDDTFLVGVTPLVMRGGEGEDTFTFVDFVADLENQEAARLIHQIEDLDVGDRIVYKSFELRRLSGDDADESSAGASGQDAFAAVYEAEDDKRPFRFRNERRDDEERTYIDVVGDTTQPDGVQFTIDVRGHHRFDFEQHA